jgi:molybdopterin converting factor small subunit
MDETSSRAETRAGRETPSITKITVKLFANLERYLPERAEKHEAVIEFAGRVTPKDVLEKLNVPREIVHLTLVNGVYIAPSEFEATMLKDGDTLAMWPPMAGGGS